ncbi:glycosyltransferase family 2 protein [Psychroserpens luteus]|uniref:Glycosyltransferase family 2 protein n=1 Tax=Psychroserpens luteus TaxID=1434066 RepID=A0ABW5ZXE2_9FLAO|nr:glycosyltransferase family 2 protein [Psychroserpens luteus]
MFNIVTPTYNRKDLISRVYDSLRKQTFKDFKWIIVDDGSSDNTKELIQTWQKETEDFEIEYYYLDQNVGKPEAVNFGLQKCDRPYTIIADSDDTHVPNTLSDLKSIWDVINLSSHNICAIWTLVIDEDNNVKGDKFPKDWWQVGFKERVLDLKNQLHGDKWHCWNTEILKAHPLYSDDGCHIGESHTWNRINKKHDFLCVNINHLKAHITEQSLITSKRSRKAEARGAYYSGYYGLKDVSTSAIISNKYYRYIAFEYAKSKFYYSDKKLKLSFSKYLVSLAIFILLIPNRLLNKL